MKTKVFFNYIAEISSRTNISFLDSVIYTTNDLTILNESLPKSKKFYVLALMLSLN